MVQETAQKLTKYLRNRLGDGLRTVVVVQGDGHEIHYLREDLERAYTTETFADVVDTFRFETPFMSPDIDSRPVGKRHAIVNYHENAFVLQFPFSESESLLVSLAPDTGRDLLDFIEQCRRLVEQDR